MEDVNIVLHNSVPCLVIETILLQISKATCQLENPTSANNRQFSFVLEYQVPTQQAQSAAIELPFREHQVEEHHQGNLVLVWKPVQSLSLSDNFVPGIRPNGQRVVGYCQESEKRGGSVGPLGLCNLHCCGLGPACNVVQEEVKVEQLLLFQTQRIRRYVFKEIGVFCCCEWGEEEGEGDGDEPHCHWRWTRNNWEIQKLRESRIQDALNIYRYWHAINKKYGNATKNIASNLRKKKTFFCY